MIEKVLAIAVILFCAVRVVSYGIYTIRDKNMYGGIGVFVFAAAVLSSSVYVFMQ